MTSISDTWTSDDFKRLIKEKYLLIIGDFVMKHLYQDLVKFFHANTFLTDEESNFQKGRFNGDHLIRMRAAKDSNPNSLYEEVREFTSGGQVKIRYYFVSRSFSSYIKDSVMKDIQIQVIKPDLIIMNSCLCDLSQSRFDTMESYKIALDHLFQCIRQILPETPFFWISTLPVSNKSEGDMIVDYLRPILPGLVRDGNAHCSQLCPKYKILYIDVHSSFIQLLHLRQTNGIYWKPVAYRILTEILLNHIRAFYVGVHEFNSRSLQNHFDKIIKTYKRQLSESSSSLRVVRPPNQNQSNLLAMIAENVKKSLENPVTKKRKRSNDEERKENEPSVNIKSMKIEHEYEEKPQIFVRPPSPPPALMIEPCNDTTFDYDSDALGITFGPSGDDSCLEPSTNSSPIKTKTTVVNEPSLIVLSSDDEDENAEEVLPIYLLIRRSLGIRFA